MKPFKNYDNARKSADFDFLPAGAYVGEIKKACPAVWKDGEIKECAPDESFDFFGIWFDITEGIHKDHFANDYRLSGESKKWRGVTKLYLPKDDGRKEDEWTKNRFARFIAAVEDSNPGFIWDWEESKLKGKAVGLLFSEEEYRGRDGSVKTTVKCNAFCSTTAVKNGTYTLPKKKTLKDNSGSVSTPLDAFMPDNVTGEELPF